MKKNSYRTLEYPMDTLANWGKPRLLIALGQFVASIELSESNPGPMDVNTGRAHPGRDLRYMFRHADQMRFPINLLEVVELL